MNELNTSLKDQAILLGLCKDWQKQWNKDWSQKKLVQRMYKGLDFCLKYHWPSNEFIAKNFDKDFLRDNNVFVNDKYSVVNPEESLVLGTSEVTFRFNSDGHGYLHIRDNSSARITAKNRSFVIVHLYENAYVSVEQFDIAKIVLVKHSDKVTIVADKSVKVREEYNYLK